VLKEVERIPGTNDLWLAQATRAMKNPGKGQWELVLLGPGNMMGTTTLYPPGSYRLRGFVRMYNEASGTWKIAVESPTATQAWNRSHRGEVYATDYATARRLLVVLAKELVYDR
jgi:hypothetical protein